MQSLRAEERARAKRLSDGEEQLKLTRAKLFEVESTSKALEDSLRKEVERSSAYEMQREGDIAELRAKVAAKDVENVVLRQAERALAVAFEDLKKQHVVALQELKSHSIVFSSRESLGRDALDRETEVKAKLFDKEKAAFTEEIASLKATVSKLKVLFCNRLLIC